MLKDLSTLIERCRNAFDSLDHTGDVRIDAELARKLTKALQQLEPKSTIEVKPFSIKIINDIGLRTDLPSSLLWYGATFWELDEALQEYETVLKRLEDYLKQNGHIQDSIRTYLKALPSKQVDYTSAIGQDVKHYISHQLSSDDRLMFEKLLEDRDWWFQPLKKSKRTSGKTLDRSDVFQSSFDLAARVIVANAAKLGTLVKAYTLSSELRTYFDSFSKTAIPHQDNHSSKETSNFEARNEIYYGAPGTGKSHTIDALTYGARKVVTVFHPDTLNSDFVGALKPMMDNGNITYQFRPGPFTIALIEALAHPNEHTYLIIEEINRAPAAAVFGELFQLLDRKDGASKYPINASDPDMLEYINSVLTASGCESIQKLFIPSNMSLLATMNSSDQAVMPLDTAFKRRWSFRYIKIDFENESISTQSFRLATSEGQVDITWSNFADKVINQTLKGLNIPEDRLLGPFFLSEAELSDTESANDALSGKLLVYLWDDVLRHRGRDAVFSKTIRTFSDLHDNFQIGINSIFSESVTQEIINYGHKLETQAETASQDSGENA